MDFSISSAATVGSSSGPIDWGSMVLGRGGLDLDIDTVRVAVMESLLGVA